MILSHLIVYAGRPINYFQSAISDALEHLNSPVGIDDRLLLVSSD
jgi:hypothetical protein